MPTLIAGRCPRFAPSVNRITDGCSEKAARAQAERINDLWKAKGGRANARAVPVAEGDSRFAIWGVRSDLVNGVAI